MPDLRKVEFNSWEADRNKPGYPYVLVNREGFFHGFFSVNDGSECVVIAMVELEDGTLREVSSPAQHMKFKT